MMVRRCTPEGISVDWVTVSLGCKQVVRVVSRIMVLPVIWWIFNLGVK